MKKLLPIILVIVLISMIAACSSRTTIEEPIVPNQPISLDESSDIEKDETDTTGTEEVEAAPLPQSLSELAALPPGYTSYISILDSEGQQKIDELTKDLPDVSGNPTENELNEFYNQLLAVYQQGFVGPEELIAKMKFQAIGSPDIENPRLQFKENLNVLVLLDASGSMNNDIGGQTQMAAAKTAITKFIEGLPPEANVGLRIYGHKGTGSSSDKPMSCSSSDLIYPISPFEKEPFTASLDQVKPAGWTPTGLALNNAAKDLSGFNGKQNTNIVYLVSDGVSTCDDNPVAEAKALYDSDITPIVNVIGFNVDNKGQKQLKEIAKAVEGSYQDVQNAETLQNELDQANEVAKNWSKWKKNKGDRLQGELVRNDLKIFSYESKEFKKIVDERQQVGFTLQYLYQTKKVISKESHDYLIKKSTEYHGWMLEEYEVLKADLKNMNEMQFNDAIQALEEKYLQDAPT